MPGLFGLDWKIQLENETLTTAPASDAQAIAGIATDVALTPANLVAALAAASSAMPLFALEYPGPAPGPALVTSKSTLHIVGTRAIDAAWTLPPGGGVRRDYVRDASSSTSLSLTGEAFCIMLEDGTMARTP